MSQRDFEDDYVKRLQDAVRQVKASREMEARYMILQEMLQEEREAGKLEGKAESIIDLLSDLPDDLPSELRERIFAEKDGEVLKRYLRLASSVETVEEFRSRMTE